MIRNEAVVPIGVFGTRGNSERVVIANPPPRFEVNSEDHLYVIEPQGPVMEAEASSEEERSSMNKNASSAMDQAFDQPASHMKPKP